MSRLSHQWLFSTERHMVPFRALALLLAVLRLAPPIFAADANEPAVIEHTQPADPGLQHSSVIRSGSMGTKDGLTLRRTAALGSVHIVPLEVGAAPLVGYSARIATDARGLAAQQLRAPYSPNATSIPPAH